MDIVTTSPRTCSIDQCEATVDARGWCKKHYERWRTHGDVHYSEPAQRFAANVTKTSGCWPWQGTTDSSGYGRLGIEGRTISAHRLSYELHVGPIDDGLHVLHRCDNPPCVRPDHLFLGTHLDNMVDLATKGRHGRAKLTASQVTEIVQLRATGLSYRAIGERFGVTDSCIYRIFSGRTWSHVTARETA